MSKGAVLVTGASSGIGLEIAVYLARQGYSVYATMRNLARRGELDAAAARHNIQLDVLQLDITNDASIQAAVRTISSKSREIYALINNAGSILRGFFEDVSEQEVRDILDANLFGTMAVTKAVVPMVREAHRGRIVILSSTARPNGFTREQRLLCKQIRSGRICGVLVARDGAVRCKGQRLAPDQVINRHLEADPRSLDPTLSLDIPGSIVLEDLFEGLVGVGIDGNTIPGIATSWETSADGKTWTFHSRKDARWSNGEPVTASDFVYAFRRLVDPATRTLSVPEREDIQGAVNF